MGWLLASEAIRIPLYLTNIALQSTNSPFYPLYQAEGSQDDHFHTKFPFDLLEGIPGKHI
jgi:hypothetical protein